MDRKWIMGEGELEEMAVMIGEMGGNVLHFLQILNSRNNDMPSLLTLSQS